jgi:hypothetical protein
MFRPHGSGAVRGIDQRFVRQFEKFLLSEP